MGLLNNETLREMELKTKEIETMARNLHGINPDLDNLLDAIELMNNGEIEPDWTKV